MFNRYKEVSLKFYTVLLSYADELQAVSVDEALLDVSHTVTNLKVQTSSQNPDNTIKDFSRVLAEQIRERMFTVTGCQGSSSTLAMFVMMTLNSQHRYWRESSFGSNSISSSKASKYLSSQHCQCFSLSGTPSLGYDLGSWLSE